MERACLSRFARPRPSLPHGRFLFAALALAALSVVSGTALAAPAAAPTTGGDFSAIWDIVSFWMQGPLGMVISGAMILVGIVAGVVRQSIMAFVIGIAAGVGLYQAPDIVESLMPATLPATLQAAEMFATLPL